MACDCWAVLKVLEVFMCLVCLIFKRVVDDQESRLFYFLQKVSREWSLLNTVTWDRNGSMFADITFGGYVIICTGLLIGHVSGALGRRARFMEGFLLGLGVLMFGATGAVILASLDSVPPELVDFAASLGTLALFTALLFLLDILTAYSRRKSYDSKTKPRVLPEKSTQTDVGQIVYDAARGADILAGRNSHVPGSGRQSRTSEENHIDSNRSTTSSADQRFLEQGEVTERPPSVTKTSPQPEVIGVKVIDVPHGILKHGTDDSRSSEESSPEEWDRVPTVSFLPGTKRAPAEKLEPAPKTQNQGIDHVRLQKASSADNFIPKNHLYQGIERLRPPRPETAEGYIPRSYLYHAFERPRLQRAETVDSLATKNITTPTAGNLPEEPESYKHMLQATESPSKLSVETLDSPQKLRVAELARRLGVEGERPYVIEFPPETPPSPGREIDAIRSQRPRGLLVRKEALDSPTVVKLNATRENEDDIPSGGSLTTQLIHRWLKNRPSKSP